MSLAFYLYIDKVWCVAGESGLHLAIVNNDLAMVKKLVKCGADVCQRASGRFFLPEDQKKQRSDVTDYHGQLQVDVIRLLLLLMMIIMTLCF